MSTSRELRFREYNTRRNLPPESGCKRGEANFLGAFVRSLIEELEPLHVHSRHFSIPGCGIADLLLCRISADPEFNGEPQATSLLAFETKLSDWKRGVQQAYRYRYYADMAIVVLPSQRALPAIRSTHVFRALGLGLWTYDAGDGVIIKHLTPEPCEPLNPSKRRQALAKVASRIGDFSLAAE